MTVSALEQLHQQCEAWHAEHRPNEGQRLVFGEGLGDQPLFMLIGEAPGQQEALQGKPFVGKAGKNLTEFLTAIHLAREALYVSNVVKIRPTRISPAGRIVNRPPTKQEVAMFAPWLYSEIALVKPRALVTLGNVALRAVAGQPLMIGDCHGKWQRVTIPTESGDGLRLSLFALYHPASVIYNRSLANVYQKDLQALASSIKDNSIWMDS